MRLTWSRLIVVTLLVASVLRIPRALSSTDTMDTHVQRDGHASDTTNNMTNVHLLLTNTDQENSVFAEDGAVNLTDPTSSILGVELEKDVYMKNGENMSANSGNEHPLRINPMNDMFSGRLMGRLTPGEQSTTVSLTYTCRERCGDTSLYPCSCSASCLIYKTCCENITQDCPDIVQHGYGIFGSFIGSDVRCEAEEIFKIESCPGGAKINKLASNMNTDFFRGMASNSNDSGDSYTEISVSELERAVFNVPVTDLVSNVTFINKAIFDCPLWQGTVEPKHWALRLKYIQISPRSLKDINKVYLPNPYAPTFNDTILDRHRCSNAIVRSCEKNEISHTNDLEQKCGEFMGVVQSKVTKMFYHNKYCAYCHEGEHNGFELAHSVSLSEDIPSPNQTVLAYVFEEYWPGETAIIFRVEKPLPYSSWISVACPSTAIFSNVQEWTTETTKLESVNRFVERNLIQNSLDRGKDIDFGSFETCDVLCGPHFFLIPSVGLCYTAVTTSLAFTDERYDFSQPRCDSVLRNVGDFITCGLSERAGNGLLEHALFSRPGPVMHMIDLTSNKMLNMLHLQVAMPAVTNKATFTHTSFLYHLAIIIRAYHAYKPATEVCQSSGETPTGPPVAFEPFVDTLGLLDAVMTKYRGPIVDTDQMIKYCTSDLTVYDHMYCYEDFLRMFDLEEVAKFLNTTKCSSFLEIGLIQHLNMILPGLSDDDMFSGATELPFNSHTTLNPDLWDTQNTFENLGNWDIQNTFENPGDSHTPSTFENTGNSDTPNPSGDSETLNTSENRDNSDILGHSGSNQSKGNSTASETSASPSLLSNTNDLLSVLLVSSFVTRRIAE